ncbi:MAG TPA: BamA/TamA family outer membrane protein [Chthoniobacterales bacterium]|jgi:outer membrane protein assembly complex protein YaeT|nr:BamA/TamA family outer membrane protein [Chthoniobacterales bacterium]
MDRTGFVFLYSTVIAAGLAAQTAVDVPKAEEKQKQQNAVAKEQEKKAQANTTVEFTGQQEFKEKDLRSAVKEQLTTIDQYGLTSARADDLAFFVEVFYRKHGYTKATVRYQIESRDRLRLEINEGSLMALGTITFEGNAHEPSKKLFEFVVGPTRERYSKLQHTLPFVASDIQEGAELVHRLYVAEGFLDAAVDQPRYTFHDEANRVDVTIPIREDRQYFFGDVVFRGQTIYGADALHGQIDDLLKQPYTDARVADIPRRLQAYFKTRGYYEVKVEATAEPERAREAHIPVQVAVSPGQLYHFSGEVFVNGLTRLRPSFVQKRFTRLKGRVYSPEALDERFRTLMKTGLFNVLKIEPTPIADEDQLLLNISAEEAKSKQLGFSLGYGTFEGGIVGAQFREGDLFGYGRPITISAEVSQRSYKGEFIYEDPFLFDTDFSFRNRAAAFTFQYDGYSKFEIGDRVELSRKITKEYEVGLVFAARHVEITDSSIARRFLGDMSYLINSLGFTQTLDLRESPLVAPRGFVFNNTVDVASTAFGSEIQLVRGTGRVAYFLPFGPKSLTPGVVADENPTLPPLQRWFQQSSLGFGARIGLEHSLNNSGPDEPTTLPIDERFFNGGATTVRSFGERTLGPLDPKGNPIGGEFYTIFNVEYTFPIYGELQGALFFDAGNLLPTSEEPGLDQMRYGLGGGLRYKLPIGPIRLDYGWNPDRQSGEDFGAFHFSFGFAF